MAKKVRASRVLAKIRSGKVALCTKINLSDPSAVELAGLAGFDAIWLDREHIPDDWQNLIHQIRTAKLYDMDSIVRVAKGSYSDLIKPLEADATAIMYPHLMSLAEAKQVVYYTKFYPVGRRPIDGGNMDGKFAQIKPQDYIKMMNRERFTIVQIEDPEPLNELEEIIKLKGIDVVFFGPSDFAQGIGFPGDFNHPRVMGIKKEIIRLCKKYQRYAGTVATIANFRETMEMGYHFITVGADVIGLGNYWHNLFRSLQELLERGRK